MKLENHHLCSIYNVDKIGANNRFFTIKKKLNKPKGGIVTVEEFCNLKGISLGQFEDLIHKKSPISI
jgi:hypothetical protein